MPGHDYLDNLLSKAGIERKKDSSEYQSSNGVVHNIEGFAIAALQGEAETLRNTPEGGRNHQLNKSAYKLGGLVKRGDLERHIVELVLWEAALGCGMKPREDNIKATIASGLDDAVARQLTVEPLRATAIPPVTVLDPTADSAPATGKAARRLKLQAASRGQPKRRKWMWDRMVPLGELTLWAGHAGIGKSQAAVWLASQVSRGTLPGEFEGSPSNVLYIGTEDSWDYTILPRLHAANANLERIYNVYVEHVDESGATEEGVISMNIDGDALKEAIVATESKLVVVDALLDVIDTTDLNKQGVARNRLSRLTRIAQELQIVIIGVAHFRKESGGAPALHMISGSAEFGQVVRSAMGFAVDRQAGDGTCIMAQMKKNLVPGNLPSTRYRIDEAFVDTDDGPTSVGRFEVVGDSDLTLEEALSNDRKEAPKLDECARWLTDYLEAKGGRVEREIIEAAAIAWGFKKATIDRAREKANIQTERSGFPARATWYLDSS